MPRRLPASILTLFTVSLSCMVLSGCASGIVQPPPAAAITPAQTIGWQAPVFGSVNALGTLTLQAAGQGNITLLHPTIAAVSGVALTLVDATSNTANNQQTLIYAFPGGSLHVRGTLAVTPSGVSLTLDADQPVIASVDSGAFDSQLQLQSIAVPYYSGQVWYSQSLSQYLNAWWDWQQTRATQLPSTSAQYLAKTDSTLNLLHEQLNVVVSPKVADTFPTIANPASPYKSQLAGRVILDSWDSSFSVTQQGLADLGDYGITNCALILHNWQHAGYDNALPEHYSANPSLGGDGGLLAITSTSNANGCLTAVHENYTDYYPNYPAFNQASLALNSVGGVIDRWLNPITNIQSFEEKPSWMVTNAKTQSPVIHQRYGTTAAYLDVNSGVAPDARQDMDAREPSAATTGLWISNATSLWSFERQTHSGPVFGEGANHWYYSGLLDGVEAQLGAGQTAQNLGDTLPLFVDFDLLRIHPIQVNHGMGYYQRWSKNGSANLSLLEQDAYRMQEIAFGHAPFLGNTAWANVPQAIVETGLVTPVATSYGTAKVAGIQYNTPSGWTDTSTAASSKSFAQVQIAYDDGLTLTANSAATLLPWNGLAIPQYGWAAKAPGLLAYTALCGSSLCDYSETPTTLFANARNQADARAGWTYAAPSVNRLIQVHSNNIAITFAWQILRELDPAINYIAFVHFVDDSEVTSTNEGIVFQADHVPSPPTPQWQPNTTVVDTPSPIQLPSSLADRTYSVRIGLYDPATDNRLPLEGLADDTARIIVGSITISGNGSKATFSPPPPQLDDPRLNAAGTVVDFGKIKTDGMVSLKQTAGNWVLRPFPRTRNFTVLMNKSAFPMPAQIQITGVPSSTLSPIDAQAYWQISLNGAKSYTWPAQ